MGLSDIKGKQCTVSKYVTQDALKGSDTDPPTADDAILQLTGEFATTITTMEAEGSPHVEKIRALTMSLVDIVAPLLSDRDSTQIRVRQHTREIAGVALALAQYALQDRPGAQNADKSAGSEGAENAERAEAGADVGNAGMIAEAWAETREMRGLLRLGTLQR